VDGPSRFVPIEGTDPAIWKAGSWQTVGRVFFRFDSGGGDSVPVRGRRD